MGKKQLLLASIVCVAVVGCAQQRMRPFTEETCNGAKCTIVVDTSDCARTGSPDAEPYKIRIKRQNVQIVWEIKPGNSPYEFRLGQSLFLKDPRGDPTGQFYGKYVVDENDRPDPQKTKGKKFQWMDQNIRAAVNDYAYTIVVFDAAGVTCTFDPIIANDP